MHNNFQMIVLICMAAISCMLGVLILKGKFRGPGANTVSMMMFAGSLGLLAFAFEISSPSSNANRFRDVISFSIWIILPLAWLFLVLQFSGREEIIDTRNLIIFSVIPLIFFLLVLTHQSHGLMWKSLTLDEDGIFLELKKTGGPLNRVFLLYSFANLFFGVYLTIQMLVQLKRCPELKHIPAVVLTTSKKEEDSIKSYELQANCYITKPVDLDQFIAIV